MSRYVEFLEEQNDLLLERWVEHVRADERITKTRIASDPVLKDDLPKLLNRIINSLKNLEVTGSSVQTQSRVIGTGEEAVAHGKSRITAGYSLPEAMLELSHLRKLIKELADEFDAQPTRKETALTDAAIDETMITAATEISDQRLNVLERISEGFISVDQEGICTYANAASASILGKKREKLGGVNLWKEFPTLEATPYGYVLRESLVSRKEKCVKDFCKSLGKWVDAYYYPDEDGVSIFFKDVSLERKAEKDLIKAKEIAEQANESKSHFLANMSHEIRTPLSAITGFTDLAIAEESSSSTLGQYLDTIKRNSKHLFSLVDDLLDLSKIEAGELDVNYEMLDVAELLNEVVQLLSPAARSKGLTIKIRYDGSIPTHICSDPGKLRQILINLVNNSIKFTDQGSISLIVQFDKTPLSPQLSFVVQDTGAGVHENQHKSIFDPFKRGKSENTKRIKGTGLGLALSRSLAQALGGNLTLEQSKPGSGSTFKVSIDPGPLDEASFITPDNHSRTTTDMQTEFQLPKKKSLTGTLVLLAEDSDDLRLLLELYLTTAGASVECFENGKELVDAAPSHDFDVILMDIEMPVMGGYEAARTLRDNEVKQPIIALTAHALKQERQKCLDAGFDGYISKPVSARTLIECISEQISDSKVRG